MGEKQPQTRQHEQQQQRFSKDFQSDFPPNHTKMKTNLRFLCKGNLQNRKTTTTTTNATTTNTTTTINDNNNNNDNDNDDNNTTTNNNNNNDTDNDNDNAQQVIWMQPLE